MAVETEIKLFITDCSAPLKLTADPLITRFLSEPFKETDMDSVYFDTPSGELSKRKWSLRLRREGGVSVVSVKAKNLSQDGVFNREEWQVKAENVKGGVESLIGMGAPAQIGVIIENNPLQERCRIRFLRKAAVLSLPEGTKIEMAIDSGEIEAAKKKEPLLELELELLSGKLDGMIKLSEMLMDKYSLKYENLSKYERALKLMGLI